MFGAAQKPGRHSPKLELRSQINFVLGLSTTEVPVMKLCPIAIAITCRRCPIVKVCPVKSVIGDYVEPSPAKPASSKTKKR